MSPEQLARVLNLYAPLVARYAHTKMHMAPEQYVHLAAAIYARAPCRLLVFGCGLDSPLWHELNRDGKTVFIEDDPHWKQLAQRQGLDVVCDHPM